MSDIKEKQNKLLALYKTFHSFAKENEVQFFAAAGTCLGAVREKGFIPWDGDLDILMPKPFYDFCEEKLSGGYKDIKWISYKNEKEAPNLMGRIYPANAEMNNLEQYPYLDVFALAGMPDQEWKQRMIMYFSLQNYRIYWIKKRKYKHSLYRKKSKIGIVLQKLLFFFPSKLCIHIFEKQMSRYPYEESNFVASLTGLYKFKEVLPKEWVKKAPACFDFCDETIPVTAYWNDYLTRLYGDDYMIPKQYRRYKN